MTEIKELLILQTAGTYLLKDRFWLIPSIASATVELANKF